MAALLQRRIRFLNPSRRQAAVAPRADYVLLVIVGALVIIGLLMIYSISFGPNVQAGLSDPLSNVERQIGFLGLGCLVLLLLARLDYHVWQQQRVAVPMMLVTLAALALLLVFGQEEQGARRWLLNGSIQPGEFAKIATVIYIAAWVTSKGTKLRQVIYGLIPFSIIVGLVAGLIAMEPNYSTSLLIAFTAFAMFFVAGADALQFGLSVLIGGLTAAGLISQSARAMERIRLVLIDPFKVSSDQVWQLAQTLIALASGGLWGKGLGTGGSQYGWVPLAHSDGIFAIWGEETGLIGTWLLVALMLALAYRGFRIASKAPDDFGRVLASGITFWLVFQAFVNMGVVTQLLPLTGQPLPFISAGGSSLVMALAGIGILVSISRGKPLPVVVKSAPRVSPAETPKAPRPASTSDVRPSKVKHASFDHGWRNRGTRLPAVGRSTRPRRPRPRN